MASKPRHSAVKAAERLRQFVAMLGQIAPRFTWYLDRHGAIRATHQDCPHAFDVITAILYHDAGVYAELEKTHDAADVLDFGDISARIVAAADRLTVDRGETIERGLRERLLKAVQLEENERFDHGR